MNTDVQVKPGYLTTEFYGTITVGLTNLLFILWASGVLTTAERDQLSGTLTTTISAAEIVITNVFLLWAYIQSRSKVKTAVVAFHTEQTKAEIAAESSVPSDIQMLKASTPVRVVRV